MAREAVVKLTIVMLLISIMLEVQLLIRCLRFVVGDKKLSVSFEKEGLDKNNFAKIFTKK